MRLKWGYGTPLQKVGVTRTRRILPKITPMFGTGYLWHLGA